MSSKHKAKRTDEFIVIDSIDLGTFATEHADGTIGQARGQDGRALIMLDLAGITHRQGADGRVNYPGTYTTPPLMFSPGGLGALARQILSLTLSPDLDDQDVTQFYDGFADGSPRGRAYAEMIRPFRQNEAGQ